MNEKFKKEQLIGTRIRDSRERNNRSRNELAESLGVSLSALQAWEMNQREPQASMIIRIAEELNVSPNYLLTGEQNAEAHKGYDSDNIVARAFARLRQEQEENPISMLNGFRAIRVSAGFGSFNEGLTEPDELVPVDNNLLQALGVNPDRCGVFWASGTSMQPTIYHGDQMLVDLSRNEVKGDNHVYLVQNGDSVWVKRVRLEWDGIQLISDNKEEYDPIKISREDAEHLQIIGRVVHVGHCL